MSETWTFVCASGELLPGEMKTAFDEVTGAPIVVFNLDGTLYALVSGIANWNVSSAAASVPMTSKGYQFLVEELKRLKTVERPKNIREIEEALPTESSALQTG